MEAGKGQRGDAGTNLALDVDREHFCKKVSLKILTVLLENQFLKTGGPKQRTK